MILADWQIRECFEQAAPLAAPAIAANVNPASIDLTLGGDFIWLRRSWLTALEHAWRFLLRRPSKVVTIRRGDAVLATTVEYVRVPATMAGLLCLKSSSARNGLDHALAGWVDPGFCGQLTLELHAHRTVQYTLGARVVQLVLMMMSATPDKPYEGRYQGQIGATPQRPEKSL